MKKTRLTWILSLFAATAATLAFASCLSGGHTHSYSQGWSFDEKYHWNNATCVHLNERKNQAEHTLEKAGETAPTYESEGYITYACSVCDYEKLEKSAEMLEHSYSSELTHENGETHWYACLDEGYGHLKKDEARHVLEEHSYDENTGYATYVCECGYSAEYIRTAILSLPSVLENTVYIGQTLSDLTLTGGQGSVDGTFVWSMPEQKITASGEYAVVFVPTDSTYAPVSGKVTINAMQLTVTVNVGENGSASVEGEVNVDYYGSLTVEFTPDDGYVVDTVTVDGSAVASASSYTFLRISQSRTLNVTFKENQSSNLPFLLTYVSGTEDAYTFENNTLTFTTVYSDSVYAISGEFDGNIVFDVGNDYKFDLEMCGFSLISDSINPITVLTGNEVSLTAKNTYDNYIYDNREAIDATDTTLYSAAIYSLVDLEICGKGSLTLESKNNNGIHTKDDLQVKNLTLSVSCVDNALKGNDGVEITGATTTLIARQGDCIKTTNSHINATTGNQKGTVSIVGGTHNLYAACDGVDAAYDVVIDDATTVLNIYTDRYSEYSETVTTVTESVYYVRYSNSNYKYSIKYFNADSDFIWVNPEYSTSVQNGNKTYYYYSFPKNTNYSKLTLYMYSSSQTQGQDDSYYFCSESLSHNDSYDTLAVSSSRGSLTCSWTSYTTSSSQGGMGGGMAGGTQEGNSDKGTYSTKGLKATNAITINQGTISVQSYDDAVHAGDGTLIDAGTALENGEVPTGNLTVNGGTLIASSHDDGIHAEGTLTVNDGVVSVTKAYEGVEGQYILINGGSVSVVSSDDGFNGTSTSGAAISISGGKVYVYATGDGIDSNSTTSKGAILFSGGQTVVICNSNGNSAIDSDGGFTHSGGQVLALMSSGGMTSESTNGNTTGMKTASVSLSSGGYATVSVNSSIALAVKMPCALSAYAVYLGSSSATIASASSISGTLDANGVYWA